MDEVCELIVFLRNVLNLKTGISMFTRSFSCGMWKRFIRIG